VQSDFLLRALYITNDSSIASILEGTLKRCGAKKIIRCKTVNEAVDNIIKKKFLTHFVIEDVSIFEQYHFFPIQFVNSCRRFAVPPPCLALCDTKEDFDVNLLKSGRFIDYFPKPLNESLLEQRIRSSFQKSYQYQSTNMLIDVIESLIYKKENDKAYSLLLPALARTPKNLDLIILLAKIYFEFKEVAFSELIVRHLIAQNKDHAAARNMLAKILLSTGRVKEANKLKL